MKAYFGKDFTYSLYPLSVDGNKYDNLTTNVDWYLFDSKPSREDAIAGTTEDGSYDILEDGSSWDNTADGKGKKFTIPAIPDPDPDSDINSAIYYIAINAELQTGEVFTVVKQIEFWRPFAHDSLLDVKPSDLTSSDPAMKVFCGCLGDLEDFIDAALSDIRTLVAGCDYDFRHLENPAELKLTVIKLAISKFWDGQSRSPNDIYIIRAMKAKDEADKLLKRVMLRFDKDQNGEPETKSQFGFRSIRILK